MWHYRPTTEIICTHELVGEIHKSTLLTILLPLGTQVARRPHPPGPEPSKPTLGLPWYKISRRHGRPRTLIPRDFIHSRDGNNATQHQQTQYNTITTRYELGQSRCCQTSGMGMPRSILHTPEYFLCAFFDTMLIMHQPTNGKRFVFSFFLSERYDRYNPKKYKSDHNLRGGGGKRKKK